MSECRVRFGHCGRSFLSPVINENASTKVIAMSGFVFRALSHFRSASSKTVHLPRLPSLVHYYRCCIFSGVTPQLGQRLVVACPHLCSIIMVGRVFIMYLVMNCDMWTVVVSRAHLNYISSVLSQYNERVRFRSSQC